MMSPVIEDNLRELAGAKEVPLLRLQAAMGLPYWLFGLLIGSLVFVILLVPGLLVLGEGARQDVVSAALFFGFSFTVIATFTSPVYRGVASDLRALSPILPLPTEIIELEARGLTRATRAQVLRTTIIGLVLGGVHSYILGHQYLPWVFMVVQIAATVGLWLVMTTTVSKMILNAAVFSRLGRLAQPDLLRASRQAPFGSAAIRPSLFVIGILSAYPLLSFGRGGTLDTAIWLGFAVSVVALFGILSLPLSGIRRRIADRRQEILLDLDGRLEAINSADLGAVSAETLRDIDTILDMRERVEQAPAWPMDLAGVRRVLLYIILPPLTWAAAALVEMLIDGWL